MTFLFRRKKKRLAEVPQSGLVEIDYRAVAATDVGSVRDNNEDHLVFIRPFDKKIRASHGCLALVADGMGGHSSGEIASKMASEIITRNYFDTHFEVLDALKRAFDKANKAIFQKASRRPQLKGMGTTCTAVVLLRDQIYLAHVGDSRAYILKGEKLIQLSNDHTYVQHLLNKGKITYEESLSHPQRNVITQAMGTSAKLQADYQLQKQKFEEGDKLLICSDGLYEYIKDEEMLQFLKNEKLSVVADKLIDLAKKRGGHDNISVLIAETFYPNPELSNKETQKIKLS
ncbi:MAG: Stp1/IreP family PP2C-type Ser/Thr phosphatase [Bacteroidia bacterium]|nr:Stp1/IreP family PP2C-type Ser/Thr phosphatase [Bacteroidia bacterium]